jgi:hypothetical protein
LVEWQVFCIRLVRGKIVLSWTISDCILLGRNCWIVLANLKISLQKEMYIKRTHISGYAQWVVRHRKTWWKIWGGHFMTCQCPW